MTIKNENVGSPAEVAIAVLRNAGHDFYMTGSRFFGGARENSDWDFFAENSYGVIGFLESNGYSRMEYAEYSEVDKHVVSVYRHNILPIDVQLVQNGALKNEAQEFLKDNIPGRFLTKEFKVERRYYWTLAYEYVVLKERAITCTTWQQIAGYPKIAAIKVYRDKYGCSLFDAKKAVEAYMTEH